MLKTFPPKKRPKLSQNTSKKQFTMSQKLCYQKWVNKVGVLKTCTDKFNIINKKM